MPLSPKLRRERRAAVKKFSPPQVFPKKRCKNCPKMFPKTRANREFCSPACKKEFHRHGSAFGPLKETLQNLVKGWLKEFRLDTEARLDQLEKQVAMLEGRMNAR
jgi:hypothetical protein